MDQRVHQKPGIYYAKLLSGDGWYQLNLLDIQLQEQGSGEVTSISTDKAAWTGGSQLCLCASLDDVICLFR